MAPSSSGWEKNSMPSSRRRSLTTLLKMTPRYQPSPLGDVVSIRFHRNAWPLSREAAKSIGSA